MKSMNEEQLKRRRAKAKEWREKNKDKISEYNKNYHRTQKSEYYFSKDYKQVRNENRRKDYKERLKEELKKKCNYCKRPIDEGSFCNGECRKKKASNSLNQYYRVPKEKVRVRKRTKTKFGKLCKSKYCEICGTKHNIEIHHKKYTDNLEDIMFVCHACHMVFHRVYPDSSGGSEKDVNHSASLAPKNQRRTITSSVKPKPKLKRSGKS